MTDADGFGPEDVAAALNVSRETLGRLRAFADLLDRWTKTHNLIGPKERARLWRRHVLDSGQLDAMAPDVAQTWVDFGSGGGFPVAIIAILNPRRTYRAIESAGKKAAFLAEAARRLDLPLTVSAGRIETLTPVPADIVSARALASLPQLLDWTEPWLKTCGQALFLKGAGVEDELTAARQRWTFTARTQPSLSGDGVVLTLTDVHRKDVAP